MWFPTAPDDGNSPPKKCVMRTNCYIEVFIIVSYLLIVYEMKLMPNVFVIVEHSL
jgi:hypothetical protein